jgi:hypothetical protein
MGILIILDVFLMADVTDHVMICHRDLVKI